ncbi:MAG: hypothetical protein IPM29_29300 [Planctomycetes bacterium]|nr:hypothetical protein [Planctomycetota bacterium]
MSEPLPAASVRSIESVCEVVSRGDPAADGPDRLVLEVPHGATRAAHFESLRAELRGEFPADLRDFFFVNTDVGAPELAVRIAELFVGAAPRRHATVVRCLVPRTFVDCNRVVDPSTGPQTSRAGQVTPGLHAWVTDPADRALLLGRHGDYARVVRAAFDAVCGAGGHGLMVHSYAPRDIDVPVDESIVQRLRDEYRPARIGSWPLRPDIDLIADDPGGVRLASASLVSGLSRALGAAGLEVAISRSYALHPATLAHALACRHPDRTLCFEVRRDLLVGDFVPFRELIARPELVERLAAPVAAALGVGVRGIPDHC